jgi:hypothetical protein
VIDREEFLPQSLTLWDAYWADPAASTQTPADAMMAIIWIETYNDYRKKKADADRMPMVEGSMGQLVANPLYGVAHQQLTMAMLCARQLGIGAKNRADLGITLLAEKQALDDINARYLGPAYDTGAEGTGHDDDDDDPRDPAGG